MELNKVWPEWQVVDKLGEGSYGKVYRCTSEKNGIKRESAIKVISVPQSETEHESLRREGMTEDTIKNYFYDMVQNFTNEIHVMEVLQGTKNIVSVEDYKVVERKDEIGWDIYIRMELLKGFRQYSEEHKMSEADVAKLGKDICIALEECEKRKILHRDIKPENIFIDGDGNFKIGDFGVARQLENTSTTMSQKGTYNYMAPEVVSKKKGDCRADIYSLGMVMYKLLNNNREPFVDPDKQMIRYRERVDAVEKRLNGEKLPAPKNASEEMANVILKACEFDKENRYASAAEFRKAIETVVPSESVSIKSRTKSVSSKVRLFVRMNKSKLAISALSLLLVACIVGGSVAVVKYRDNAKNESFSNTSVDVGNESNRCGMDVTYEFNKDTGVLTLSGTGATFDYIVENNGNSNVPWKNESVRWIVVKDGITRIGTNLFNGSDSLEKVTLPDSLTEIGVNAFEGCDQLNTLVIPNSVEIIESGAFEDCGSLEYITMSENIKRIGYNAFYNSFDYNNNSDNNYYLGNALIKANILEETITVKNGTTVIADGAFCDDSEDSTGENATTKEVYLPDDVISIGDGTFRWCTALNKIDIGKSVEEIGEYAFWGCKNLTDISISESIKKIGNYAFDSCSNLSKVSLPEKAIELGAKIFAETAIEKADKNWIDGGLYVGKHLFDMNFSQSRIYVNSGTLSVASCIAEFYERNKFTVNIPASVEYIGFIGEVSFINSSDHHYDVGGIFAIDVSDDNKMYSSDDGVLFDKEKHTLLKYPEYKNDVKYVIPNGVTEIADYAFSHTYVTDVFLPESLKTIGKYAFYDSDLKSIDIPDSVTTIQEGAFYYSFTLSKIDFSANLKYLSESVFFGCYFDDLIIPDNIEVIEYNALAMDSLSSVTIPKKTIFTSDYIFGEKNPTSPTPITVFCYKNSPAYNLAVKKLFSVKLIDEEK